MDDNRTEHEHSGYGVYLLTWFALLVFTAITVAVAGMQLGKLSVLTALVIASIKATIVLYFFMHLKYERPLYKTMFFVSIGALTIFIGITFFDVLFR
jgi:cytochrome c oxidase subunit 4